MRPIAAGMMVTQASTRFQVFSCQQVYANGLVYSGLARGGIGLTNAQGRPVQQIVMPERHYAVLVTLFKRSEA